MSPRKSILVISRRSFLRPSEILASVLPHTAILAAFSCLLFYKLLITS